MIIQTTPPVWTVTEKTSQTRSYPSLIGKEITDVVIIGGGITGITAAYLLSKAGKKVVVLEAHSIGLGTSGHSTGNLYCTIDDRLEHFQKKYDKETTRKVLQSRKGAIDLIETIISEQQLDCQFQRVPWVLCAEKKENISVIESEAAILSEAGFAPELLSDLKLPVKILKAVKLNNQAQFNPLQYVTQLASSAASETCKIYEHSKAIKWDEHDEYVEVETESGSVKARHLIMATHTPKGFELVQTVLGPYREYGLASLTETNSVSPGIYWIHGSSSHHSLRNYRHGNDNYLIVIGEYFKTGQDEDTRINISATLDFLTRCGISKPTHIWGAQHYRPADGLPYIGRKGDGARTFYATGFATDGLTYGTLAAKIITDEITGSANEWSELYKYSRHQPGKSAGKFLKENLNAAAQYIKNVPGVGANENEIQPGEGKVVDYHGKKLAVYRDAHGQTTSMSAVCPHLGCIVKFNQAERSWDCPCHGSRFTLEGEVIEGPAIRGLSKKEDED